METLDLSAARRLALARAGLLLPERTGLPRRASGRGRRARRAAQAVVERFGYLQLDTVSVAGARSHAIVLLSRLDGFEAALGEELLVAGAPLFEYWGHEASWLPLDLYPAMEFRRREFAHHPWWGDVAGEHPRVAADLLRRLRDEGPLHANELDGKGGRGWWDLEVGKRVALHLWSRGDLAVRERRLFQRTWDLVERVVPERLRASPLPEDEGIAALLLRALDGHGWATTGTLAATWRLKNRRPQLEAILARLAEAGEIVRCSLAAGDERRLAGWVRPRDLELAAELERARPRVAPVLLSPFDPLLWGRGRVGLLFGFQQVLEIFKPAGKRLYGYYCLPVLAGEELVARVDLVARRRAGTLRVVACHLEGAAGGGGRERRLEAVHSAVERFARGVGLEISGEVPWSAPGSRAGHAIP